ncbi:MAG: hypothetical protein LH472_15940 [Pyrinomonadaceae bacterium]|nr:hypothetical protein [Pyrinomonadaceae bacterium]
MSADKNLEIISIRLLSSASKNTIKIIYAEWRRGLFDLILFSIIFSSIALRYIAGDLR